MNNQLENKKKNTKQIRKLGITEAGWERLSQFLNQVNSNAKRKVKLPDILEYAVSKLGESDVGKIQERSYTAQDRIDIAWQEYSIQNPAKAITRDEFLDMIIQGHSHSGRRKANGKQLNLNDPGVSDASYL